jgi:predicted GNAT family acetyltransferase
MEVKHNTAQRIFYIGESEAQAFAEMTYRINNESIIVDHTYVDPARRGTGVADLLYKEAKKFCENQGLNMDATCSYVVRKLQRENR